jgi:hypothetical protein
MTQLLKDMDVAESRRLLKDAIISVVTSHNGCKGTELPVLFAKIYSDNAQIWPLFIAPYFQETLTELVAEKHLVEIEYVLSGMPYRTKSFYLPAGTQVEVK